MQQTILVFRPPVSNDTRIFDRSGGPKVERAPKADSHGERPVGSPTSLVPEGTFGTEWTRRRWAPGLVDGQRSGEAIGVTGQSTDGEAECRTEGRSGGHSARRGSVMI